MSTIDVVSQCTCVCNCGGKTRMHKAEQDRHLIHFLMWLNDLYTAIRGNILMQSALPSMAQAFATGKETHEVKPHNNTTLVSTSLSTSVTHNNTGSKGLISKPTTILTEEVQVTLTHPTPTPTTCSNVALTLAIGLTCSVIFASDLTNQIQMLQASWISIMSKVSQG